MGKAEKWVQRSARASEVASLPSPTRGGGVTVHHEGILMGRISKGSKRYKPPCEGLLMGRISNGRSDTSVGGFYITKQVTKAFLQVVVSITFRE
jgi:hypothetical protein